MNRGTLHLMPAPFGDDGDPLYEYYRNSNLFSQIDIFLFETPSKGHKIIKKINPEISLSKENVYTLDKNSKKLDLTNYISLLSDKNLAILPDAGMPGISDPGRKLVRLAHKENIPVRPVIASSSVTASVASSGLNGEKFVYHGYLPRNKQKRIAYLKDIELDSKRTGFTQIFIETPYRNIHVWKDLMNFLSDSTDLSISVELFSSECIIKTARVSDWKKMKWPALDDKNAIFLINAKKETE